MSRFAPHLFISFAILLLLAVMHNSAEAQDDPPPQNVLLLIADDYGVDNASLYNLINDTPPTPVINSLRDDGVQFMNAWSYPICSPTRATMLTGRYGFRTGVGTVVMGSHPGIDLNEFTLPKALDAASGSTIAHANIGKWHLSSSQNGRRDNPNLMGYDHYAGILQGGVSSYFDWDKVVNGSAITSTTYTTTDLVDDAITWLDIQNADDKQWFMWLAFNAPHTPFHLPPLDLHSYDSLPGDATHINDNPQDYYFAMVEALDTEIGRLLDALPADVRSNTTVIFIGDNGSPARVANGSLPRTHAKGSLYNGGTHVPMLISSPIVSNPARNFDGLVNSVDLFPTILELMGVDLNSVLPEDVTIDGQSLVPALSEMRQVTARTSIFTEVFEHTNPGGAGHSIRNESYHLMRAQDTGDEEFYHLTSDPFEATNLLVDGLSEVEEANYCALYQDLTALLSSESGVAVPDLPEECRAPTAVSEVERQVPFVRQPSVVWLLALFVLLTVVAGARLYRSV